jgi:hypothetical protein
MIEKSDVFVSDGGVLKAVVKQRLLLLEFLIITVPFILIMKK